MADVQPRRALRKKASLKEVSDLINDALDDGDVHKICEAIRTAIMIHDIKQIAERAKHRGIMAQTPQEI
jgi:hypothetical protein